jgi:hypothetical protein
VLSQRTSQSLPVSNLKAAACWEAAANANPATIGFSAAQLWARLGFPVVFLKIFICDSSVYSV